MLGRSHLFLLKLAVALVPLALILLLMHFLLPGLAWRSEERLLGSHYASEEIGRFRVVSPRGSGLAPLVVQATEAFLAALYADYGQALALQPIEGQITIRLFASQSDLEKFAAHRMKQDLSHAGGFYDPASWSLAITVRPAPALLACLFHEATHLVMDRSATLGDPAWSLWVAEGMAVFFENSAIVVGRLRLGGPDRRDAAVVLTYARGGRHVPLRRLVRAGPEVFRSELGPLAYREAGLLAAYLLTGGGPKLREAFLRYYQIERRPGPVPPDALETHLGLSLDALERDWLAYLRKVAQG
jgi:hypothetical protein